MATVLQYEEWSKNIINIVSIYCLIKNLTHQIKLLIFYQLFTIANNSINQQKYSRTNVLFDILYLDAVWGIDSIPGKFKSADNCNGYKRYFGLF